MLSLEKVKRYWIKDTRVRKQLALRNPYSIMLRFFSSAYYVATVFVATSSFSVEGYNCDTMPGNWSSYWSDGAPSGDHFLVDWAPDRGNGAFNITLVSNNEKWHSASCSLLSGNSTASCYFPDVDVWLGGQTSFGCLKIDWNNTSTFMKDLELAKVHLLFMSHLDVGFTGLINDVHNSYLDSHYPRALALAAAMRANASSQDRFSYTTHPWLLSLYFSCPENFTLSNVTLKCPNSTQIEDMRSAIIRGDIQFHAAPFNVEWEGVAFPEFALTYFALAKNLSSEFGVPAPRTASTRDVPGVTRGLIPILASAGVTRFSEGCNPSTQPPAMPSPSIWRDEASGTQILYVQHSWGYGGKNRNPLASERRFSLGGKLGDASCAIVPGWNEALCFNFRGEGAGPPDNVQEVIDTFSAFRAEFPGASVVSSSFDAYFDALEEIADSLLPVVTSEAGDSWINGYAGDPTKMSLYRIIASAYSECSRNGQCDLSDPRLSAFARFGAKSPEHTWGLGPIDAEAEFLWANEDLRAALTPGSGVPEFLSHQNSYIEQRNVTSVYALAALGDHPLASTIAARIEESTPSWPSPGNDYDLVPNSNWTNLFSAALPGGGSVQLAFDGSAGGIASLVINGSSNLAVPQRPLAALVYKEFNSSDWAKATTCPIAYQRYGDDAAGARSATTRATMDALYVQQGTGPRSFLVHATFSERLVFLVGAPQDAWINVTITYCGEIIVDVQLFNKTSTRFGEAILLEWLLSPSALTPVDGVWRVDKLGSWLDPLDGVAGGSTQQHAVGQGVAFYSTSRGPVGGGVFLDTIDAPVMCPASGVNQTYTSLPLSPAPFDGPVSGWASLLLTNAWAMNFPLWSLDSAYRFRFKLRVLPPPPPTKE